MSTLKVATSASRQINAVVVSAGLMQKTVKVRIGLQKWNSHIRKVRVHPFNPLMYSYYLQSLRVVELQSQSAPPGT